jgi:Leucine-rich repeat (LRR) protein
MEHSSTTTGAEAQNRKKIVALDLKSADSSNENNMSTHDALTTFTTDSTPEAYKVSTSDIRRWKKVGWKSKLTRRQKSTESLEDELKQHLRVAVEQLLDSLFIYLSNLPEPSSTSSSTAVGLTVPASAVGWLSQKLFSDTDFGAQNEGGLAEPNSSLLSGSLPGRLALIKFLLPRATHVRLTSERWPSRRNQKAMEAEDTIHVMCDHNPRGDTSGSFLEYYDALIHRPRVDMRVFCQCKVLLIAQVPPSSIVNLYCIRNTLQILRVERSCIFDLPSFLLPAEKNNTRSDFEDPLSSLAAPIIYPNLVHAKLSFCGLDELSGMRGRRRADQTRDQPPLGSLTALQSLNLSHNEIVSERTALSSARRMPFLQRLDLSHNRITSLRNAHYRLGNIQTLRLSYNRLRSVQGIDRLYSLESLWLDHNELEDLTSISGLSRLPELQTLHLRGNPLELLRLRTYRIGVFDLFCERRLANLDQNATFRQLQRALPSLDLERPSLMEMKALRERTFAPTYAVARPHRDSEGATGLVTENANISSTQENGNFGALSRATVASFAMPKLTTGIKRSAKRRHAPIRGMDVDWKQGRIRPYQSNACSPIVDFTSIDVLVSMSEISEAQFESVTLIETKHSHDQCEQAGENGVENNIKIEPSLFEEYLRAADRVGSIPVDPDGGRGTTFFKASMKTVVGTDKDGEVPGERLGDACGNIDIVKGDEAAAADEEISAKYPKNTEAHDSQSITTFLETIKEGQGMPTTNAFDSSSEVRAYVGLKGNPSNVNENTSPHLLSMSVFNDNIDMDSDFDDELGGDLLSKGPSTRNHGSSGVIGLTNPSLIAEQSIPTDHNRMNRLSLSPIKRKPPNQDLTIPQATTEAFSEASFDVDGEASTPPRSVIVNDLDEGNWDQHRSLRSETSSCVQMSNEEQLVINVTSFPDSLWHDDTNSIHSATVTPTRNKNSDPGKFVLAERNATYEGPVHCKNFLIYDNLDFYFQLFVFPPRSGKMCEAAAPTSWPGGAEEDWRGVLERFPRIQLWLVDRQLREAANRESMSAHTFEEYRRVWRERVVACGKPALRRLTPNRTARYGFHGELLWSAAGSSHLKPETVAESRNVLLCLSNEAFYLLSDHDKVSAKAVEQKKTFPIPIPERARFSDAKFPHSMARHPLSQLRSIAIGFGFQRLTLRFRDLTSVNEDDFTYILLISNKTQTVNLLKELQQYAGDKATSISGLIASDNAVTIENDDRYVLDAVGVAVAPDVIDTILHYQILQQRWKHGERGTVKRVCIVTDAKIYLLDEDYLGDGSESIDAGSRTLGEPTYRLVDSASLSLIDKVQAADADPNSITIVIQPLTRLQRFRNWRLLCHDSQGAERLVEDVRKAVEFAS